MICRVPCTRFTTPCRWIATNGWHKMNWELPDVSKVRLGSPGYDQTGFRRATIAEHIQVATLKVGGDHWPVATRKIRESVALIRRIAASQNKVLKMTNTPDELARHWV